MEHLATHTVEETFSLSIRRPRQKTTEIRLAALTFHLRQLAHIESPLMFH